VAGVGGIGSWVAYYLAISRLVDKIEVVDFDYVEPHNLNRTPYRPSHVGLLKVYAIKEVIKEVNEQVEVVTYDVPLEYAVGKLESEILVEATDSLSLRPVLAGWLESGKKLVTAHYDGESITIGVNVVPGAWGDDEGGYATAPVYVATPTVAAALVVHILAWMGDGGLMEGGYTVKLTLTDIVKTFTAWRV
jgi:hypothetical protein